MNKSEEAMDSESAMIAPTTDKCFINYTMNKYMQFEEILLAFDVDEEK
jgi:hypothetical protein